MDEKKTVFPSNYKISLEPDLQKYTFKGTEIITLQIEKAVSKIELDAVNLNVSACFLLDGGERIELPFKQTKEKLVITSDKFEDGENEVEIEFAGILNDKLAGFYRSDYQEDGKTKILATTQFEAADARQAFPCFDEPAFKATFDITLVVDKNLTAISNMPVLEEEKLPKDLKAITFDKTPIMSTYLLYFGVGEFEIKEDRYKNVLLRGITTKGKSEFTEFALDAAKKSLEFFETYFDIPYPLPKLDLIAIPDFASGAMENWGAITFRENALIFYPEKSSLSSKQRIAEVVAHEVAHQWFGNLVTMKWWDDLWLNESFATFMAYKVLDTYWPDWDMWTEYLMMTVFEGMYLDSLKSSHPIKVNVNSIEEMNELFDEIAYDKGGSVLRMIERFMGDKAFKKGLRTYMSKFKYQNTEAKDLWKALDEQNPEDIEPLVEKFITQTGFPFVTIMEKELTQQRFLSNETKNAEGLWDIPLVIRYKNGNEETQVLHKTKMPFESNNLQTINGDYGGFFITHFSETVFINVAASFSSLTSREKIGFIHDLYYLTKFRKSSLQQLMSFIKSHLMEETDPAVMHYTLGVIDAIDELLDLKEAKVLIKELAKRSLKLIGNEPQKEENSFNTFLRAASLATLSEIGDIETRSFLNSKFAGFLKDSKSLHPDLKQAVFSNAVRVSDINYEKIKKLYLTTNVQEEKLKYLSALAKTQNKVLLQKTLDFSLTPDVKFANVMYPISSASSNKIGKEIALNWVINQWDEFGKRVGGHGGVLLRRFVKIVFPVCGIGYENEIKQFIQKNKIVGLEKTFEQVWEELEINGSFVRSNKA